LRKTVIIGLGNILLRDEGVGSWIAQELQKRRLPSQVEVIDAGTTSPDALLAEGNIKKVVIVDALKGNGEPGALYRIPFNQLLSSQDFPLSLHQFGLLHSLWFTPGCEEIVVMGVEPEEISWGWGLSENIKKKLPEITDLILKEVNYAGNGI